MAMAIFLCQSRPILILRYQDIYHFITSVYAYLNEWSNNCDKILVELLKNLVSCSAERVDVQSATYIY